MLIAPLLLSDFFQFVGKSYDHLISRSRWSHIARVAQGGGRENGE